jgi:hypothetical protein
MAPFDDSLFGDLRAGSPLTEAEMQRIAAQARRRAERQKPGLEGIRARGAERAEIARQISEALRMNDTLTARDLIEEAARLGYSHADMLDAVQVRAREAQTAALEAAGEPYHDDAWEGWPE